MLTRLIHLCFIIKMATYFRGIFTNSNYGGKMTKVKLDIKREEQQSIAKNINQSLETLQDLVQKYNNASKHDNNKSITRTQSYCRLPSEHK